MMILGKSSTELKLEALRERLVEQEQNKQKEETNKRLEVKGGLEESVQFDEPTIKFIRHELRFANNNLYKGIDKKMLDIAQVQNRKLDYLTKVIEEYILNKK